MTVTAASTGDLDPTPPLRLRALPQPQPEEWSPATAAPHTSSRHLHALRNPAGRPEDQASQDADRTGAAQQAFVLHGLPTASLEPAFEDPVPTPTADLPCPELLARRLVQAAMDVVRGHRPATQVLRWTTPEVYSQLRQRARLEQMSPRHDGRRPVVRSLRTSPCGERGVEVSAVVLDGPRARAVAARLDGEDSRWRLTALVIG